MISYALAAAFLLAAAPSDSFGSSRQAYSTCLQQQLDSNLKKKASVADFDSAITNSCARQEAAFRAAVIAQQMSMKASRKDAEQAAADWVSDFRANAAENYEDMAAAGAPAT
jgi:hypothetical protein